MDSRVQAPRDTGERHLTEKLSWGVGRICKDMKPFICVALVPVINSSVLFELGIAGNGTPRITDDANATNTMM